MTSLPPPTAHEMVTAWGRALVTKGYSTPVPERDASDAHATLKFDVPARFLKDATRDHATDSDRQDLEAIVVALASQTTREWTAAFLAGQYQLDKERN